MPFSGDTFTLPAGSTNAAAGQIVQSAVWNNIHSDINTGMTQLMTQLVSGVTNRNILWMNGGFEIWQRGAGASAIISVAAGTTAYTADRWYITTGANQAHTISAGTTLSNASQLAGVISRTAGQTGVGAMVFGYPLDTDELVRMRGSKITLSFLVKTGVNFSPTNGTLVATLYVGTGSVAKRGGGFTNETSVLAISTNLTAGGAAVAVSGTSSAVVPTTATQGELQFSWTPVGTAGAVDTFTLDDVQIECDLTSTTWTPTTFDRLPFNEMLAGCMRHYRKTFPYSVAPAQAAGFPGALATIAVATQRLNMYWQYPIEMRATAAVTTYNPSGATANWQDATAVVSVAVTIDTANGNSQRGILIYSTASGSTTNDLVYIQAQADAGI